MPDEEYNIDKSGVPTSTESDTDHNGDDIVM